MPRVSIQLLLIVIAMTAVWFAAGECEVWVAQDLRKCVWLVAFLVPLFYTLYARGSLQAFWIGVLAGSFAYVGPRNWPVFSQIAPQFYLFKHANYGLGPNTSDRVVNTLQETTLFLSVALLSLICGFVSATIYKTVHPKRQCVSVTK